MKVVPIPVLGSSANYAYLVIDQHSNIAAAVDPAEPDTVIEVANKLNVNITTILTTHHHWDHADGNPGMCSKIPNLRVVGADDRIPALNYKVKDQDSFSIGSLEVTVRYTPCHTSGSIFYIVKAEGQQLALFSGDTLFIAGCGKFFEGTAEQMHHALQVAASYPDNTELWCGHEYTLSNLKFALHIEPNNQAIQNKLKWSEDRLAAQLPTVPSTIGEEKTYNPFMRVSYPSVKTAVGSETDSDATTMFNLREAKNNFSVAKK